jgi:hypothetical protein
VAPSTRSKTTVPPFADHAGVVSSPAERVSCRERDPSALLRRMFEKATEYTTDRASGDHLGQYAAAVSGTGLRRCPPGLKVYSWAPLGSVGQPEQESTIAPAGPGALAAAPPAARTAPTSPTAIVTMAFIDLRATMNVRFVAFKCAP